MKPLFTNFAILTLIITAGGASFVAAQEEPGMVKAEILTLGESGVIKDLHFRTIDGIGKLSVYSRGFGPPIQYQGPQEMVFFRPMPNPEKLEGGDFLVVGRVTLPDRASRVLLLFKPRKDTEKEAYQILAIDNDLSRFPEGAYRFVNTSTQNLTGRMGQQLFELKPQAFLIVDASSSVDSFGNVELALYRKEDGVSKRIYSSVWHVKKSRRTTVFLSTSQSRVQEIEVKKIVEPLVPVKKTAE
ncbi:MAG: hypothetical protein KDN20_03800 [Verrucomicrobiae bacterium]|nr:hypothetical protein [Verrucomicrobiae bacterium]